MTDPFDIPSSERGGVRVFTTDLEPEGNAAITPGNVHKLLGQNLELDASRVEVFPSKALDGMGLSTYLHEGYGVPMNDLKGTSAALDALTGLVILVASSAFQGKGGTPRAKDRRAVRRYLLRAAPGPSGQDDTARCGRGSAFAERRSATASVAQGRQPHARSACPVDCRRPCAFPCSLTPQSHDVASFQERSPDRP